LKCLEKDPKPRYSSALALAEDLEHWLKHEPIQANPSGVFTHSRKWVQRKPAVAALVASSVALAAVMGWNVWQSELISRPAAKSVAVLPFENRSEDKANAYFADAIQDEILTRLSKIADLKVISRTSTQHYKSAPGNLAKIAKQLGVAHILEGSVQKSGDAVRVNVQLIKAATDSHLWADTFDRKLTDVFSVESEVAKAIADQLRAKLTGQEEQAIAAKPTDNPRASIKADACIVGARHVIKECASAGSCVLCALSVVLEHSSTGGGVKAGIAIENRIRTDGGVGTPEGICMQRFPADCGVQSAVCVVKEGFKTNGRVVGHRVVG
jgi:TolB-like protein